MLTIDFPRIPYPASQQVFAHVAEKGGQLSRSGEGAVADAHNNGSQTRADPSPRPSPAKGEGVVGRVHINPDQYFENVPAIAWEFHIGGYQPAQKWLKDRKGRALSFGDVMHYQKIIKILCKTDRIMKEIDLPL